MGLGAMVQRARQDWQKEERREAILEAAERLFQENRGVFSPVSAVADRVGLAKGTIYLYFRTKEHMYLNLLDWRVSQWTEDVRRMLGGIAGPIQVEDVIGAVLNYPLEHPTLLRLATYSSSVLEQNIDTDTAFAFKRGLTERMAILGGQIEERLPGLPAGEGAKLLLRSYCHLLGLWQVAEPPAVVRAVLDRDGVDLYRINFAAEARWGLTALWRAALDRRDRTAERGL